MISRDLVDGATAELGFGLQGLDLSEDAPLPKLGLELRSGQGGAGAPGTGVDSADALAPARVQVIAVYP